MPAAGGGRPGVPVSGVHRALRAARRLPVRALVLVVRAYQLVLSPLSPPSCRYYPSCSQYAVVALERHGLLRGAWLAGRRLLRCHPWAAGGVDDVPGRPDPIDLRGHGSARAARVHAAH